MLDTTRPVTFYARNLLADRADPTCRPRYIRVIIHPDAEHLRREATRYDTRDDRRSSPEDGYTDTIGIFHPSHFTATIGSDRRTWTDETLPFAGVLRLASGNLTAEIITHEATHAALHITRLHNWHAHGGGRADLGDTLGTKEEAFAYLLGDIVRVVNERVWEYDRSTQGRIAPTAHHSQTERTSSAPHRL